MKSLSRLFVLLVLIGSFSFVEAGTQLTSLMIGAGQNLSFKSIDKMPNGDLLLGGSVLVEKRGRIYNYDWLLTRVDEEMNVKWIKTFGGPYSDYLHRVKALENGQILMIGDQKIEDPNRRGKTKQSPWMIRIDADGNQLWEWSYRKSQGAKAQGVSGVLGSAVANNGDVLMTSLIVDLKQLTNRVQAWLVRVNQQGEIQWEKSYGAENDDRPRSLTSLANGDILLAGDFWQINPNGPTEGMLLRLNKNGNQLWRKAIKAAKGLWISGSAELPNGNLVLIGRHKAKPDTKKSGPFIKVLDPKGKEVWSYSESGTSNKEYQAVAVSGGGHIIVTGAISPGRSGQYDAVIERFTAEGRPVYQKMYDKQGAESGLGVLIQPKGLFHVVGSFKAKGEKKWQGMMFSADSRGVLSN